MKVWWVLTGDNYYPGADNFAKSFETEDEAIAFAKEFEDSNDDNWTWCEIINIADRL